MKTLIAYASRHGCTAAAAKKLVAGIKGESTLVDLKRGNPPSPGEFDAVIVGGSIHAGRIQGKVTAFLQKHGPELQKKKLGLFLCHMEQGDGAQREFDAVYPAILREKAAAKGLFGGAFDFSAMNFLERFIVGKVAKVKESVSRVDDRAIAAFIDRWNSA